MISCGVYVHTLRFLYPLTIQDAVFDEALDILDKALLTALYAKDNFKIYTEMIGLRKKSIHALAVHIAIVQSVDIHGVYKSNAISLGHLEDILGIGI